MNRLPLLQSGRRAVLPLQYFGSVGYYTAMAAYPEVVVDVNMRYDKRFKSAHRMDIVDTRGPLQLTAAIGHTKARTWAEVPVSVHGRWWHVHLTSLESAYGRTPFFEFYIDRFSHIFRERTPESCESVADLCREADTIVRSILDLPTAVSYEAPDAPADFDDLLRADFTLKNPVTYYQVRADKLGFRHDLSILDLIFNLGPEAPLLLLAQAERRFGDITAPQ